MSKSNSSDDFSDEYLWAFVERTNLNELKERATCRDKEIISKIWYGHQAAEDSELPVANEEGRTTKIRSNVARSLQLLTECCSRYALHLVAVLAIWAVGFGMGGWFFSAKQNVQVAAQPASQVPVAVATSALPEPAINPDESKPHGKHRNMLTTYDKDLATQKVEEQVMRTRLIRVLQWYRDQFAPEENRPNSQMQGSQDSVLVRPLNNEESAAFEALIQALYKTIAKTYPDYRP